MKSEIQLSSFIAGCLCVISIFLWTGFTHSSQEPVVGSYQAVYSERGFLILDTRTGEFILGPEGSYVGKSRLIKGEFRDGFKSGKEAFSKK